MLMVLGGSVGKVGAPCTDATVLNPGLVPTPGSFAACIPLLSHQMLLVLKQETLFLKKISLEVCAGYIKCCS